MQKIIHVSVDVDGYVSGETEFEPAFARACDNIPGFSDLFETNIMAPMVEVAPDPTQCGFFHATGHSDRVDTAGLTRQQIREQEYDASRARVRNASDGIFAMLNARLGGVFGADWSSVPNIAENSQGLGAALLANSDDALSEAQRQQNRRIHCQFIQYVP